MKNKINKLFWGIIFLFAAGVFLLYGTGNSSRLFQGLSFLEISLLVILGVMIMHKFIFGQTLRTKLRIFTLSALVFMVIEDELIPYWGNGYDFGIINNWALLGAGIMLDFAVGFLIPKKKITGHRNRFSSSTHYIDITETPKCNISNKMGDTCVFFQNTDMPEAPQKIQLTINNRMGNVVIHAPENWAIEDKVYTTMGNIEIRPSKGNEKTLVLDGENHMGNIEITSP